MRVTGTRINGSPAFFVAGESQDAARRASFGTYSVALRGWAFPAYYPFGLTALKDLEVAYGVLHLDPLAEAFATELNAPEPMPPPPEFFPEGFQPFDHQLAGILQVARWPRLWLQWDMGTGKTRTVLDGLRLLRERSGFKQALVIGPKVVIAGWIRETSRVSRGAWTAVHWDGSAEAAEAARTADIVVLTYTRAYLECQFEIQDPLTGTEAIHAPERSRLLALDYDVLVLDESHVLGNVESRPTTAVAALAEKAIRRIALSGTPGDTPGNIYSQLRILAPWLIPLSWFEFQKRHYVYADQGGRRIHVGYERLNEINAAVDKIASRKKKSECLDLPPQIVVDVPFDLGENQRARYNELVATMRASITPDTKFLRAEGREIEEVPATLFQLPHGAARVNKLLQLVSGFLYDRVDESVCDACPRMETCVREEVKPYTKKCPVFPSKPPLKVIRDVENPKLDAFTELLSMILAEDATNKVLCWGYFPPELDDMERVAKKLGGNPVRLDGKTSGRIGEIEDAIRDDPSCRVLVGAISAGVGINLQRANYSIFYSLSWKPREYDQALDRNNRPGQTRKTTAYRLLSSTKRGVAMDRFVEGSFRFKRGVGFTMTEIVTCASCERLEECHQQGVVPFGKGCKYAAAVARPVAKVEEL